MFALIHRACPPRSAHARAARSCILWVLALLTFAPATAVRGQQAIFELVVNSVANGETLVVLRDGDVLVPVQVLTDAGLRDFAGRRETVAGQTFVSLASLAPQLSFRVDERELVLRVDAAADLLTGRVRDLQSGAPRDVVYRRDPSTFLNYGIGWNGGAQFDFAAESGATLHGGLLHNTLSAVNGSVTRGLTSFTIDDRRRLRRWTVGDSFAQTDGLGGSAFLAGLTVTKEFGVDPYFVRHPTLSVATPITTPSVVEVYVNDRLVSQEQVAPGRLDLQNLPVTRGRNDARVVVRDAFGGSREFSTDYYLSTSALVRGLHSYQYSVGFVREAPGASSWDYSAPALLARHRVGLTDRITAGGRLEASRGLVSAGPSLNLRLPVGEVEAAAGVSGTARGTGTASYVSYMYAGWPVSGGVSLGLFDDRYARLGIEASVERPARQLSLFTSVPVAKRLNVTLQHSQEALHDDTVRGRTAVLASTRLTQHADLTLSAARVRSASGRTHEVFVGVTMPFGRTSASTAVVRDEAGSRTAVDVMRSLPVGPGYGYQLRAEAGSRNMLSGLAQYQNAYGHYELRRDVVTGSEQVRAQASGALVGIGGRLYATRPVRSSFALLQVPGVEGVRAFVSNQEIGRTDARGDLLVPELEAYYGNTLRIADEDIPLDYSVDGTRLTLAPPYRGGAVATFPVKSTRRIHGVIGIATSEGTRTPIRGRLTIVAGGAELVSPVGAGGEFYLEDVEDGDYAARLEDEGGACSFTLTIAGGSSHVVQLGPVVCPGADAR